MVQIIKAIVTLQVLRQNLNFINDWEIMLAEKQISKEQFLTSSTAEGLRVTITSTLELCDYLLSTRKFNYVLTNKMNQDPIEVCTFPGIVMSFKVTNK